MPTARELLEQADALMRRHRGSAPEVPAPSRVGPVVSPRPIQREPISPSVARTSLPVDPTESPMFEVDVPETPPAAHPTVVSPSAAPPNVSPPPVNPPAAADIPLLTEAVPLEETDDVPLLTDAVEEIDIPSVAEAPADDDPSLWLDTEQGSEMILPEVAPAPSVPAEAPEALHPDAPVPGRDPLGLDHPAPGFDLPASSTAEFADVAPFGDVPQSEIPTELRDAGAHATPLEPASLEAQRAEALPPEAKGQPPEARPPDAVESAPIAPSDEQPPTEEPAHDAADSSSASASDDMPFDERARDSIWLEPSATSDLGRAPEPVRDDAAARAMPAEAALPAIAPLDEARIREIAEEISMQVLQRIDIFADTGLRSQLGDLLKPAIERASGELVTAINQHVGELVRAFVAEAVDREIEQWRRRQQP